MKANFLDLHAAADFLGPGAIEINRYQTEITDIVRRRGVFGQRMKQVPATGQPSRFFEETAIPSPTATQAFVDPRNIAPTLQVPTRVERTVPLKALVSQINYNLFDMEVGTQQSQFAYLQAKDLADAVDGLLRTHDVSLWNGNDTSLSAPTTPQYFGAIGQIVAGGNTATIATTASIVDGLKSTIAEMVSSSSFDVRPTAIYANPVLLDLIDREMKSEFNVVLSTVQITGGLTVKALSTQAGELPLIPEWALPYTGTPGSGTAVLPAYIVTEDLIEYHWLTDPNPRIFKLGLPNTLMTQSVVVKFGGMVVKGANYAHYEVLVNR
ncbi:MAG TPA: hypothetical protein VJX30_18610 [Terriglobales bacterium]|jgi:hypothetical protein|nr:hypothetical protein [Terriglobales bacterium]